MIKRKDFKILSDIHDISLDETKIIELSPGTTIGPKVGSSRRYEIITLLGTGCIGCVYLVKDHESSGKLFVLKIIIPHHLNTQAKVDKFISLINDLYQLEHENYIEIIDLWKQKKLYFFVMEHIEGAALSDWLQQQKNTGKYVSIVDACKMVLQLCEVVKYFHETRAHRLLHPNNILIGEGDDICLKIGDLGLEELLNDSAWERLSIHENYQNYLSPESGSSSADGRLCDIYALGSILYEILTFQSYEEHIRLSSIRYDIPPGLDDIITKATRINPAERYRDIDALILALNTFQKSMVARKAKTLRYKESEVREKEKLNEASQILGAIVQKYKQKEKEKQKDEPQADEEQMASKFEEINAALKTKHEHFQIVETSRQKSPQPNNVEKVQNSEDELLELSKQIQTTPEENHMEKLFAEETTKREALSDIGPLEAIPVDPEEFPENEEKEKPQAEKKEESEEPLLGKPKKLKLKRYFPGAKSTGTNIKKISEEDREKRHITKKKLISSIQEQKEQNIADDFAHAQSILEKAKEEEQEQENTAAENTADTNATENTEEISSAESGDEIATTNKNKLKKYSLPSGNKKKRFKVTIDYKKDLESLGAPKKVGFSGAEQSEDNDAGENLKDAAENTEENTVGASTDSDGKSDTVDSESSQESATEDSKTSREAVWEQETQIDRKVERASEILDEPDEKQSLEQHGLDLEDLAQSDSTSEVNSTEESGESEAVEDEPEEESESVEEDESASDESESMEDESEAEESESEEKSESVEEGTSESDESEPVEDELEEKSESAKEDESESDESELVEDEPKAEESKPEEKSESVEEGESESDEPEPVEDEPQAEESVPEETVSDEATEEKQSQLEEENESKESVSSESEVTLSEPEDKDESAGKADEQDDSEVENEIQQVLNEGDELAMDNLFEEAIYKWMQVAHLIDPVEIEERLMQVIDMAVEIAQDHLDSDEIWEAKKLLDQVIEHNQDDFVQSLYDEINGKLDNREQEFQEAIGQVNNHIQKKQYQAAIDILNTIRDSFPEHSEVLDEQIVKVESAQRQIVADEEEYMQLMYTAKLLEDKENFQEALQTLEKIHQKQNVWRCPVTDISSDIERVSKMVASMQPSNKANQILTQIENLITQNKWKEAHEAFENPIFNRKLLPKVEKRIAEKKKKLAELQQQRKKKLATMVTLGVTCLVVVAVLVYTFAL
ncbi:serine/threonine protein kinase [Candidatus Uabimicrobium amorphum]|uniref:non-specific serine/threonine protein kinase n=1 Tax=Uabimicrobium amorphum TaxID=2596890 RepID=A0A5S9IUX8_UABAM|nr:serine/threonine protein kinase [Candidatus Uabimicrobium amorphum]BBM87045.1 serine/threonine protein kinase [Candidatus Uabimicrobium amorphum]